MEEGWDHFECQESGYYSVDSLEYIRTTMDSTSYYTGEDNALL
jgi:hypothetical protein